MFSYFISYLRILNVFLSKLPQFFLDPPHFLAHQTLFLFLFLFLLLLPPFLSPSPPIKANFPCPNILRYVILSTLDWSTYHGICSYRKTVCPSPSPQNLLIALQ